MQFDARARTHTHTHLAAKLVKHVEGEVLRADAVIRDVVLLSNLQHARRHRCGGLVSAQQEKGERVRPGGKSSVPHAGASVANASPKAREGWGLARARSPVRTSGRCRT